VDIVAGSTSGRDYLRSFLRAGATTAADADIQAAWDTAVAATWRWIKPPFRNAAPQGVVDFVTNVAAHIYRTRDSAGDTQVLPDGTFQTANSITSNLVRRYAVLGGPYVTSPRVVA
jgi:hypothetical protein